VKRFPGAQMGPTPQHYDLARTGQADVAWFLHGGTPGRFPLTDVLSLAAWVDGVVVVEAGLRSGSLLTGRLALDLGKELWVCPGTPENSLMEGPNHLLREGAARVCRSARDLLEDMNLRLGT